jgi:hypothetical protein
VARESGSFVKFSLSCAVLAMACNGAGLSTEDETFEVQDNQIEFRGKSNQSALSKDEWKAYLSDRKYLRELARSGDAVGLNHADPRQHEFAQLRLKLVGKTPANSPQLFRQMEQLKAEHQAKGLPVGTVESITPQEVVVASQHRALATGGDAAQHTVTAGALASRKDQLSYGYVDSTTWDEEGNPLGDTTYVEVYGNLRYSTTQADGDMNAAAGTVFEGDSFLTETLASGGSKQSYVVAKPQDINAINSLNVPTIEHPRDTDANGYAMVCLERDSGDCEYHNMGMWTLRLPLKGSISLAGAGMTIDWPLITNSYQSAAGPSPGKIYATLGTNGGGCTIPPTGVGMTMRSFWQQVSVSPANNPTTMSWDLFTNNANWADFGAGCQLVQAQVYVTMELEIPFKNIITGTKGTLPVTISNAIFPRPLTPPNLGYKPPFRVTNSCLAAGTMVAVGGSAARKIEELSVGDTVASSHASSLTIIDTSVGTESAPMVRIADGRGRELMMTEEHPIYVVDRGMVAAKSLKVGDRVKTDDGTSELVRVTREPYSGKVFNLKVGNETEARALGEDQTTMFANGFLVGDMHIQGKHELLAQEALNAIPKRLPGQWRKDYQASRAHTRSSK